MKQLKFLFENASWLIAGLILSFASSFGQTFFIGLFGSQYREELGLSHGDFGALYMGATLFSALLLVYKGGIADSMSTRTLGALVMAGLALVCLAMWQVAHIWQLFLIIFGLRFLGQGMLSHVGVTAIARWFTATRGRALAIASWGHPIGEGLLPLIVALLIMHFAWRDVWLAIAALILLALIPLYLLILRGERIPQGTEIEGERIAGMEGRHWTRAEVLRTRFFWLLLAPLMASPLIGTSALFHQSHIAELKGWTMAQFTAGFPFYAGLSVLFSMMFGVLVDRYSARRIMPFYILPLGIGLLVLALVDRPWGALIALGGIGATAGASMATLGSVWAELYGTKHLGSIRSLSVAAMVFSTALGPGLTGWLIDLGVTFETQCLWMAMICVMTAIGLRALMQRSLSPA